MADAVLTLWQNVDQEPADELVCLQGHGLVPTGAIDAVILDAESDVIGIGPDQAAVGNCDPVSISRQVRQDCFGSSEGFLGVEC